MPEPLAVMQPEPGEQGLPRLLTDGDVATLRRPIVLSVDTEEVKMFTTPVKGLGELYGVGRRLFLRGPRGAAISGD
jgi:hypothetical protein